MLRVRPLVVVVEATPELRVRQTAVRDAAELSDGLVSVESEGNDLRLAKFVPQSDDVVDVAGVGETHEVIELRFTKQRPE